jgi:hypothetical protein
VAAGKFNTPGDDKSHHQIFGWMEKFTQHENHYIAIMDGSCVKGPRKARLAKSTGRDTG